MIPVTAYPDHRVGVLGLGRSGIAAARALEAGGAIPVCWDDNEAARADCPFEIADLTREREVAALAALIVSPGIPHLYPEPHGAVFQALAAGVPVNNDVGLFFRELPNLEPDDDPLPQVIAVTGSNGKSTTTALIAHILEAAGKPVQMGGNIGRGVLDLEPPEPGTVYVLELSSYQIELAGMLAPDVAVFLNLSDDHLDRHGGRGGYFAAKKRLFEVGAPEIAVIGVDETEGRFLAGMLDGPVLISVTSRLRGDGLSVFMNKAFLTEWRSKQIAAVDLRAMPALVGTHNHQNACAAWAAARAVGVAPRRIEAAMRTFPGLAHRMERIGERGGVIWVNDSKATNADAAEKALRSFDRIRWIAGGQAKAGGIESLRPLFGRVAKVYLIGAAAEAFAATLGKTPHMVARELETAVAMAAREAQPGDVVLLSPACASFDQFTSFEARGDAFRALAQASLEAAG